MKLLARVLILIGLALVAVGHRIERPEPPAAKSVITLPRRNFRPAPFDKLRMQPPSRLEVFRLGLQVLFSSARFGLIGV